jgi:hypothetical protein
MGEADFRIGSNAEITFYDLNVPFYLDVCLDV